MGAIIGIAVSAVPILGGIAALGSCYLKHREHEHNVAQKAKDDARQQALDDAMAKEREAVNKERSELHGMVINVIARGTTTATTSTTVDLARGSGPTLEAATADMLKHPGLELRNPTAPQLAVLPADDPSGSV